MATVANLNVNLVANNKDLSKKLKQSGDEVSRFSKISNAALSVASGVGMAAMAGVGVAMAGVGIAAVAVSKQIGEMSNIVDASNRIGVSTVDLIGFQHAAQLAGMGADDLTGAMQTMQVNISKAANGTGKARLALQQLGIDAKTFNDLRPEEQMRQLADALAKVENPADKARMAMAIFGDAKMVNVLEGGSAGLKAMADDAAHLGLTMSDYMASNIETAGDAVDRMGMALDGTARQLTALVAPAVEAASNAIVEALAWLRESLFGSQADMEVWIMGIKVALDNAGNIWRLWSSTLALTLVSTYEDIRFQFNNILTEIDRLLAKAALKMAVFKGQMTQGQADMVMGMMATVSNAPRVLSDVEKKLMADVARNGNNLAVGVAASAAGHLVDRANKNAPKEVGQGIDKEAKTKAEKTSQLGLLERGSKEAYEVIAKAMNQTEDTDEEIAENTKDSADSLEEIAGVFKGWGAAEV